MQGCRIKNVGFVTRNTHVKYQISRTHCSEVIRKVKVSDRRITEYVRQNKNNVSPNLPSQGQKKLLVQVNFDISNLLGLNKYFEISMGSRNRSLNYLPLLHQYCVFFNVGNKLTSKR